MHRLVRNTAITLIAALLTLALVEAALRQAQPRAAEPPPSSLRAVPSDIDGQSYRLQPGDSLTTLGVAFHVSVLGLRDDLDPSTGARILCMGDSVTFGSGVELNQTFPKALEKRLNATLGGDDQVQVLNAGIYGYNAANVRAHLEYLAPIAHPDLVIYTFVENDLDDSFSASSDGALLETAPDKGPDEAFFTETFAVKWMARKRAALRWQDQFALTRLIARALEPKASLPSLLLHCDHPETRARWDAFKSNLEAMKRLCLSENSHFMIQGWGLRKRSDACLKRVSEICKALDIPFVSTVALFDRDSYMRKHSLGYDAHPNPEAHALMAESLEAFIRRQGFLPIKEAPEIAGKNLRNSKFSAMDFDEIEAEKLESIAGHLSPTVDFQSGAGIYNALGGVDGEGKMARSCILRLGGTGDHFCVTARALITDTTSGQSLLAFVEDATQSLRHALSSEFRPLLFKIPERYKERNVEIRFAVEGPVWIPSPQERQKGVKPHTIQLKRVSRGEAIPPQPR